MESQQHALEILMDLRRLVAAHGEFLAKFGQHTEEAPESLAERSPPHQPWNTRPPDQQTVTGPQRGWSLPPLVTTAPLGIKPQALPRLRLEPPRFDGENARDWIRKIQEYYNYHYTPLDDRLYLIQYLFDYPASDWFAYWMDNNSGKGWDDFLLAVKQRFDPDPYEGRLATLRQTSSLDVVGVDLSLNSDRHVPTYGMGKETDKAVLIYINATPVRKPHSSTSDLLTLSEAPSPAVPSGTTAARAYQPADEVGKMILEVDEEILDVGEENKLDAPPLKKYVVATDSSIIDAATDSVLDVDTKFFSMDKVVYDESLGSNEVDPSNDEDTTSLFACDLAQPTVTFNL